MACQPFNSEFMVPSWVCCQCNPKTLNGNNREACKICGHKRCDNPAVIRVPVQDADGIRIVPVKTSPKDVN